MHLLAGMPLFTSLVFRQAFRASRVRSIARHLGLAYEIVINQFAVYLLFV